MRALLMVIGLIVTLPAMGTEIVWSVENGFPVFRGTEAFKKIKKSWKPGLSASDFLATQNAASLRELLPKTSETLWNPATGLYDKKALFKRDHTIVAQVRGAPEGAYCLWFRDGKQYGKSVPCTDDFKISLPERVSTRLSVEPVDGEKGLANVFIKTHTILAFGDSFASGEGNPDRAAMGTEKSTDDLIKGSRILSAKDMAGGRFSKGADWWDTTCHRSLLSWQSMYALKLVVSDPHLVVRFASFSCSGAEIYDGFFRAQMSPPANDVSNRVGHWSTRDGGNFLELVSKRAGEPRQEDKVSGELLNKSQLNAAIHLLCPEDPYHAGSHSFQPETTALGNRKYYGAVKYDACKKQMQAVDEVLLSFGGNDFGFSGVVKWGLVPGGIYESQWSDSTSVILAGLGGVQDLVHMTGLSGLRLYLGVINPERAANTAKPHLKKVYANLGYALTKYLHIQPDKVQALLYPNPIQTPFQEYCKNRLNLGNVAMTESVVQYLGANRGKKFMFLIEEANGTKIEQQFINHLRENQEAAIGDSEYTKWTSIDSQLAFQGRSLCAVSPECDAGATCPESERFAWTKGGELKTNHPSMTPIPTFARWEPYISTRTRGIRTGNDAFMTMARFNSNGELLDDWFSGAVHPDARAHSAIADLIVLPTIKEPESN
ncbi:hypothetical protein [Pseudomonas prosekii]|uniref:hypothetical protein n=1 Tax=Pseudomonas prosekii TaxID=1148509 RepID=UPI003F74CEBC